MVQANKKELERHAKDYYKAKEIHTQSGIALQNPNISESSRARYNCDQEAYNLQMTDSDPKMQLSRGRYERTVKYLPAHKNLLGRKYPKSADPIIKAQEKQFNPSHVASKKKNRTVPDSGA